MKGPREERERESRAIRRQMEREKERAGERDGERPRERAREREKKKHMPLKEKNNIERQGHFLSTFEGDAVVFWNLLCFFVDFLCLCPI